MIRPFTCLCLAAACGSGLYLYSEKHRTAMLDRDIAGVIHATEAARARTGLLRAEWALLNEPGRLQDMADKYLALKPMAPTQFVSIADLPNRLPPPETAAEEAASTDDEDADGTPPATPAADAAAQTAAPPPAPLAVAEAAPPKPAPASKDAHTAPKILARAEPKPKPTHHVTVADRQYTPRDGMLAHGTPLPLAAPQPIGARVYSAVAHPMPQPVRPPVIAAVPRYEPPFVGSALGSHPALPPPTPYAQ